jgi:hypothetical protein
VPGLSGGQPVAREGPGAVSSHCIPQIHQGPDEPDDTGECLAEADRPPPQADFRCLSTARALTLSGHEDLLHQSSPATGEASRQPWWHSMNVEGSQLLFQPVPRLGSRRDGVSAARWCRRPFGPHRRSRCGHNEPCGSGSLPADRLLTRCSIARAGTMIAALVAGRDAEQQIGIDMSS